MKKEQELPDLEFFSLRDKSLDHLDKMPGRLDEISLPPTPVLL
jgi:hypothetical protein